MGKRLNYSDRKKLIEARDKGSTDAQIKTQFGFKDDRTLRRHMRLAEHEQEARSVRVEIVKDALSSHLAEIGTLIEEWKRSIVAPPVYQVSFATISPKDRIESSDLFRSLRAHLPSPTLWRDYTVWKNKLDEYIGNCGRLRQDVEQEAGKWGRVRRLTENFSEPIFKRLHEMQLEELKAPDHTFSRMVESVNRQGRPVPEFEILLVDGIRVMEAEDALAYEERYKALSQNIPTRGAALALIAQYRDLKMLEPKIHEALRDILIRRDYIMYTCKLCPGQSRPLP
jgi:hypothetical protein